MTSDFQLMCGICGHDAPAHYSNCPVLTGVWTSGTAQLQRQMVLGPETPEAMFQRDCLAKLSAIQSDVARILAILTGQRPSTGTSQMDCAREERP